MILNSNKTFCLLYHGSLPEDVNKLCSHQEIPKSFVSVSFSNLYYCELLQTSENHISLDYLQQVKQKDELKKSEKVEYYFTITLRWTIKTLLILIPVIVSIILAMQGMFNGILW